MKQRYKSLICNALILSTLITVSGCGETLLDGSSDDALMKSYLELKKTLTEREGAAFDLAFHNSRELVNQETSESSKNAKRMMMFDSKNVAQLISDAKTRFEADMVTVTQAMQESALCLKSYTDGLKLSNQRIKNSSIDPENRVEYSFDLINNSKYSISALQLDLTLSIFGSPDYERKFDGDNNIKCFTPVSVPSGGSGRFTCNIRYNMDKIKVDGPVEEQTQFFEVKIVNNDSDLQDGKEDKNSISSCREEVDKHRAELKVLTSYVEQLMTYRR